MAGIENGMNRRGFLRVTAGTAAAMLLPEISFGANEKAERPNILWLSCEDTSPDLGCYGDKYAVTPNIDKLAAQGVRYENCFTHAGVCAPSRSGVITGMYPTTIGTHQMRCQGVPPEYVKCFPEYLRAAGYYCTNNSKTDYQFDPPPSAWDGCSNKAHWRNRPEGQPFFAVFNYTTSHESQIRNRSKTMLDRIANLGDKKHDPAKAKLPPYYPDTPIVREDWAQYYDVITLMDLQVGAALKELEDASLADDTIVWFWGDHGRGLPRAKRWLYDSGLRVPLIIRVPEKWRRLALPGNPGGSTGQALKPGSVNDDLVAFIDFAPTMLSLAGIKIPDHIQGRAFLGPQKTNPRDYIYAARDRMDETYDLIRAVRDKRYKYIRNYMSHVTRGQDISYMNEMPTMQEMRRLNAEGKLKGPQLQYFEPAKPVEELYDCQNDPHEINNLAGKQEYKDVLERLRAAHQQWVADTSDIGLIPESEFDQIKRPNGQYQTTADPVFWVANQTHIGIASPTAGASIVYRTGPASWKFYTEPVGLSPGQTLRARACRIGFKDSAEVTFKTGDKIAAQPPQIKQADPDHWHSKVAPEMLERLRRIKTLDGQDEKAIPQYTEAINDEYAPVRYWAAVGLHASCKSQEQRQSAADALRQKLDDPSTVVRVAAAHALCDWGHDEQALPVLADALKDNNAKARLYAVTALDKIGEKARPILPHIEIAVEDSDEYVRRVARTTINRLENR